MTSLIVCRDQARKINEENEFTKMTPIIFVISKLIDEDFKDFEIMKKVTQTLIKFGADPYLPSNKYPSAIQISEYYNFAEIISILKIDAPELVDPTLSVEGQLRQFIGEEISLYESIRDIPSLSIELNLEQARIMHGHEPIINKISKFGKLPLQMAFLYHKDNLSNLKASVTLLLQHNADPTAKDANGISCLESAKDFGINPEIIELMEQYIQTSNEGEADSDIKDDIVIETYDESDFFYFS